MGWIGTNKDETYNDTAGANDMDGKGGNDRLYGLDGNDVFHVTGGVGLSPGFDYFNGGGGYNTIFVDTSYTDLQITGLSAADNINEIQGYAGPDAGPGTRIVADGLSGRGATLDFSNTSIIANVTEIVGSSAADTITGNGRPIPIKAGGGDDTLHQSQGSDAIDGGDGYDTYYAKGARSDYKPQTAGGAIHTGSTWTFSRGTSTYTLTGVERVVFSDGEVLSSAPPGSPTDADTSADQLPENTADGARTGITARATDPDGGAITYSLADDAGGRFAIDAATGAVTVANAALIDYETATSHTVTVRATDATGQYAIRSFTIQVLDGNDAPVAPADGDAAANTVAEGAATGTAVGVTAAATDPNAGDSVTYSLTDSAGGRFAINAATGAVTVADGALLDYETATSHRITVRAWDGTLGRTTTFTVAVTNVSDDPVWTGTAGADAFAATSPDDWTLSGLDGADALTGGTGADTLAGGTGDDTLNGGAGDDRYLFAGADGGFDAVVGGTGTDTIAATQNGTVIGLRSVVGVEAITAGTSAGVTISGDGAANVLNLSAVALTGIARIGGGGGDDTITGGADGDAISGGAGDDTLNGGAGDDTFLVSGTGDGFDAITGGTGADTLQAAADGTVIGLSALATVERITSGGHTGVTISGDEAANRLNFGLVTLGGITRIGGGAGNDAITGSAGADTLAGEGGDDTLDGGPGDDAFLFTGTGDGFDTLTGGAGADTARATAAGTAIGLRSVSGVEVFTAGGNADVSIRGSAAADGLDFSVATLVGIAGIGGGAGNDTIKGSAGDDTFTFAGAAEGYDSITGNGGTDTLRATAAGTVIGLSAFASIEAITGGGYGGVTISGGTGAETFDFSAVALTGIEAINGGAGGDTITGSAGADTISGGTGNDTLDGGAGADTFSVGGTDQGFDRIEGGAGNDTIAAASAGTAIGLSGLSGLSGVERITASGLPGVTVQGGTGADTLDFSAVTLTGIALVDGGAGGDTITGSAGADAIAGGAGDDALDGGAGNDEFRVGGTGQGFDRLVGGAGDDRLVATRDNTVLGLSGLDGVETIGADGYIGVTVQGGAGADTLDFSAVRLVGIGRIDGGAGGDAITGSAGADVIAGGAGDDVLSGGAGDDTFLVSGVGQGADTVAGGAGTDTIRAGAANTVLSFSGLSGVEAITNVGADGTRHAGVVIRGGTGADVLDFSAVALTGIALLDGGTGGDTITGSAGDDVIAGGAGDDVLNGGAGDDSFRFGAAAQGNDTVAGGAGEDRIEATANGATIGLSALSGVEVISAVADGIAYTGVTVQGGAGADVLDFSGIALIGVARIDGGAGGDAITGSSGDDTIQGGAGADVLRGGGGSDTASYANSTGAVAVDLTAATQAGGDAAGDRLTGFRDLSGSAYADTLTGDANDNTLAGNGGNDTLRGGLGRDTLDGGAGSDTASYDGGPGVAVNLADGATGGGAAGDVLVSIENLIGSAFGDVLTGTAASNVLTGGAGGDVLDGGAGTDTLVGGAGDDAYYVDVASDTTTEAAGEGTDRVYATAAAYILGANVESLSFIGTGAFTGTGNALANAITGGAGADTLLGGGGRDTLTGGAGADLFKLTAATDSAVGGGADLITDFSAAGGDKLDLSALDADPVLGGNQAFGFIGSAAFTGKGQVRAEVQADGNTHVFGTTSGTTPGFEVVLTGTVALQASSFVL